LVGSGFNNEFTTSKQKHTEKETHQRLTDSNIDDNKTQNKEKRVNSEQFGGLSLGG